LETVDRKHTSFLLLSHKEVSKLKAIFAGRDLTKLLGAPKRKKNGDSLRESAGKEGKEEGTRD
jgi:hypothetical protein